MSHHDYLEMGDAATPPSPTPTRKSFWMAAISTTLLLAGASVAYTSSTKGNGIDAVTAWLPWRHQKPSELMLTADATSASNGASAKGPNKVLITFPEGPLKDGYITTATIVLAECARQNPPPVVEISAPGVHFGQYYFTFSADDDSTFEQRVACRTAPGSNKAQNGKLVAVPVKFNYPAHGMAPTFVAEQQVVQREQHASGRCSSWGDPHLTTFDGVPFDFQPDGVFRYFQIRNLFQVQVFQEKCPPTNTGKTTNAAPSCYQAVAIKYADSILRVSLTTNDTNKLVVTKGSSSLKWLQLYKLDGDTQGYRIFLSVDETSYIDITVGLWVMNYGYINIVAQLSPYFKDPSVTGIMGNWNGDAQDDSRDQDALAHDHRFPLDHNLFTCDSGTDGCQSFGDAVASDMDELALSMPMGNEKLRQGFTAVDESTIELAPYIPTWRTLAPKALLAQDEEGDNAATATGCANDVTKRALELCNRVITEIQVCDKYVANKSFFIYNICLEDAVLVNDLSVVDHTKIAYLRECRRELEAQLIAAEGNAVERAKLEKDRVTLQFGDLSACPQDCNAHGECLAAGCDCHAGYTGYACSIHI